MPGRALEVPFHTKKEIAATMALAMDITEGRWTVKVRDAGPSEPEPDETVAAGLWTGVLPVVTGFGDPQPSDQAGPGLPVSPAILARLRNPAG